MTSSRKTFTVAAIAFSCWLLPVDHASAIIDGTDDPPPSSVVAISGQTSSGASGFIRSSRAIHVLLVVAAVALARTRRRR